jgi:hypothetical protein
MSRKSIAFILKHPIHFIEIDYRHRALYIYNVHIYTYIHMYKRTFVCDYIRVISKHLFTCYFILTLNTHTLTEADNLYGTFAIKYPYIFIRST